MQKAGIRGSPIYTRHMYIQDHLLTSEGSEISYYYIRYMYIQDYLFTYEGSEISYCSLNRIYTKSRKALGKKRKKS